LTGAGGGNAVGVNRLTRMAHASVTGAKGKLALAAERPLARRTPLSRDTIRTLFGALFLAISVRTVYRALRAGLR
jgi:hypothetical protein